MGVCFPKSCLADKMGVTHAKLALVLLVPCPSIQRDSGVECFKRSRHSVARYHFARWQS